MLVIFGKFKATS